MNDLQGLHIIVTRPLAQAEPWAKRLMQLSASVSLVPLLELVAVQDGPQIQTIKNCILNFDLYTKAIFVSQNAVNYGFEWLDNYWPQLPVGVSYFAVGAATATAMQARGVSVTDLAQTQRGAMTSEALLQSPALQHVTGEKILIIRGLGGRTHLNEVLTSRGAKVDCCELYERHLPAAATTQFAQVLKSKTVVLPIIVTLHSGESLDNLLAVLKQLATSTEFSALKKIVPSKHTKMQQLILLVPSERVAEQAIDAGFGTIFTAENATESSMLQRLFDIKASLEN